MQLDKIAFWQGMASLNSSCSLQLIKSEKGFTKVSFEIVIVTDVLYYSCVRAILIGRMPETKLYFESKLWMDEWRQNVKILLVKTIPKCSKHLPMNTPDLLPVDP